MGTRLTSLVEQVAAARKAQRGDKRFDLVMAGYFTDMFRVLLNLRPLLDPKGRVLLILGDSALYGVHVKTDEFVGELVHRGGNLSPVPEA